MSAIEGRSLALNYPVGIALGLTGALGLSSGGILLRSIEAADGWQIMIYRSVFFIITLLVVIAVRHRGRVLAPFGKIGTDGILVALILGAGFTAYVFAILNTTVANAMFILSGAPVLAALFGWLIIHERIRRSTWLIIVVSIAGIGIMVANGLATGRILGNLCALGAALTFAIAITLLRRSSAEDMLPATCLAGVVALLCALALADSYTISSWDLMLCLVLGVFQVGVGFICYTYAPRFIPAAEVALLGLLETILSPVWVWIGIGETPDQFTMIGGLVVFACVCIFTVNALLEQRSRSKARLRKSRE